MLDMMKDCKCGGEPEWTTITVWRKLRRPIRQSFRIRCRECNDTVEGNDDWKVLTEWNAKQKARLKVTA